MNGAAEPAVTEDDLHAFVDDGLDPRRRATVEAWLSARPEVATRIAVDCDLRRRLRERLAPIMQEPIPERLRIANLAPRPVAAVRSGPAWWARAAAALVLLLAGAAAGWAGRAAFRNEPVLAFDRPGTLTQDAVAAFRTFVPEAVHPVEVKADQRPHLVQWLSKRMGEAVLVPDLGTFGFSLMGGRIVPTGEDKPAALLMFDDAQGTRLTLYGRYEGVEEAGGPTRFHYTRSGDVSSISWGGDDCAYVLSARIGRDRLRTLAEAIEAQQRTATDARL